MKQNKKCPFLSAFDGSETIGFDSFTTVEMACLALFFFFFFFSHWMSDFIYFSFEIPARLSHSNVWRFQSGGTLAGSGFVSRHIWKSYDTLDNMRHCYYDKHENYKTGHGREKNKFVAAWNFFRFVICMCPTRSVTVVLFFKMIFSHNTLPLWLWLVLLSRLSCRLGVSFTFLFVFFLFLSSDIDSSVAHFRLTWTDSRVGGFPFFNFCHWMTSLNTNDDRLSIQSPWTGFSNWLRISIAHTHTLEWCYLLLISLR